MNALATARWAGAALPSNALMALLAAASWGGGDFAGGMGVKVSGGGLMSSLRVILVAHTTSLVAVAFLYGLMGGGLPHGTAILWALLAGVTAGLSITAFYLSLARGAMGAPAAVSGLLAAAIPAAASSMLEGRPGLLQMLGFLVAGAAIWLIAASPESEISMKDDAAGSPLFLAVLGGLGFGIYFLLLRLANPLGVLLPIALARTASVLTSALLLAVLQRLARHRLRPASPVGLIGAFRWTGLTKAALAWAMAAALLDTGGNLLFVASTRLGRLDVASVLASLYPAGTILLAAVYLHERPARQQVVGMGLALAAVVLVAV